MLMYRIKITVVAAIILAGITFMVFAEENTQIDINQLRQKNPFVQFAGNLNQAPKAMPGTPKPELFIETATLKFIDAKSLKASIANMSSEWGNMEPDGKSNSLIICDTKEDLAKIIDQIRKVDRRPDQIMIEVVLLDVKLNNETEIGVNWDMLTGKQRDEAYRQSLGFSNRLTMTVPTATTLADYTAFASNGTGADFSIINGDIRNVIHALQQKNNVEILASPRVMVVSGKEATIEAVEEIPYSEQSDTSSGGALTSTQFKNVGVKLSVGATLTDDKLILLNINTEQNVQTDTSIVTGGIGASGVPVVDTRKIQSSLLLNDGQILVIGGLRRKETQKQTNQLPILGDLPVIGFIFQATDTIQNNSELLVILSPHIYKGEIPIDVEMNKYNEITKRPLLMIPEDEKQKDKNKEDKENKKAKKSKKQQKSAVDVN
jgi:type II secretory pathway component GspD/PulD (secretin)